MFVNLTKPTIELLLSFSIQTKLALFLNMKKNCGLTKCQVKNAKFTKMTVRIMTS
jgi:hypothetical protein